MYIHFTLYLSPAISKNFTVSMIVIKLENGKKHNKTQWGCLISKMIVIFDL